VAVERRLSQRRASASSTVSSTKDDGTIQPQSAVPPSPSTAATAATAAAANVLSADGAAASVSSFLATSGSSVAQEMDVLAPVLRRDRGPLPADRGPLPADRGPLPADRRRALVFEAESTPSISAADVGVIDFLSTDSNNDVFSAPPVTRTAAAAGAIHSTQQQDLSHAHTQVLSETRAVPQVFVSDVVQETHLDLATPSCSVPSDKTRHPVLSDDHGPSAYKDSSSRSQSSSPALSRRVGTLDGRASPLLVNRNKDDLDGPSPPFLPPAAPTPLPMPAEVSSALGQTVNSITSSAREGSEHNSARGVSPAAVPAAVPAGILVLSSSDPAAEESTSDQLGPTLMLETSLRGRISAFGESGTDGDPDEIAAHRDLALVSSAALPAAVVAVAHQAADETRSSPVTLLTLAKTAAPQIVLEHREPLQSHTEPSFTRLGQSSPHHQPSPAPPLLASPPAEFSELAPPTSFAGMSQQDNNDDDTASSDDEEAQHEGLSFHQLVQAAALGVTTDSFVEETPHSSLLAAQAYSGSMDSLADDTAAAPAAFGDGTVLSAGSACGSLGDLSGVGLDNALQVASSGGDAREGSDESEKEQDGDNAGHVQASEQQEDFNSMSTTFTPTTAAESYATRAAVPPTQIAAVLSPSPRPRPVPRPRSTLFLDTPQQQGTSPSADSLVSTLVSSTVEHARAGTVSPLPMTAVHSVEARALAAPMPTPRPRVPSSVSLSAQDQQQRSEPAPAHVARPADVAQEASDLVTAVVSDSSSTVQQHVEEAAGLIKHHTGASAQSERSQASSSPFPSSSSARSSPTLQPAGVPAQAQHVTAPVPSSQPQSPAASSPRSESPLAVPAAITLDDASALVAIGHESRVAENVGISEDSCPQSSPAPLQAENIVTAPMVSAPNDAANAPRVALKVAASEDAEAVMPEPEPKPAASPTSQVAKEESAVNPPPMETLQEQPIAAPIVSSAPNEPASLSHGTVASSFAPLVSSAVSTAAAAAAAAAHTVAPAATGPDSGVESTPVHSPPAEPIAPVSTLEPESVPVAQAHGGAPARLIEALATAASAEPQPQPAAASSLANGHVRKEELPAPVTSTVPASASVAEPAPASSMTAAQTRPLTREELVEKVKAEARARTEALRQRIRAESDARFKGPPAGQPSA
jgi:hypothetical protein